MSRKRNNSKNKNIFRKPNSTNIEAENDLNNDFDFGFEEDNFDMDSDMDFDIDSDLEFGNSTESENTISNLTRSDRNPNFERRPRLRGNITTTTCQELANIIGGEVITSTPVCVVQRLRNIQATILGRRTRSPLALPFALSFENNIGGKTLNLGETVLREKEVNPFLTALSKRGITITAVHNHWLFEKPRLMYMHWEILGDPFDFAINSFDAATEAGVL